MVSDTTDEEGKVILPIRAPKDCWKKDHKGNIFARYKNLYDRKMADLDKRNSTKKDVEMQDIENPGEPGEELPQATSQKNKYLSGSVLSDRVHPASVGAA